MRCLSTECEHESCSMQLAFSSPTIKHGVCYEPTRVDDICPAHSERVTVGTVRRSACSVAVELVGIKVLNIQTMVLVKVGEAVIHENRSIHSSGYGEV